MLFVKGTQNCLIKTKKKSIFKNAGKFTINYNKCKTQDKFRYVGKQFYSFSNISLKDLFTFAPDETI